MAILLLDPESTHEKFKMSLLEESLQVPIIQSSDSMDALRKVNQYDASLFIFDPFEYNFKTYKDHGSYLIRQMQKRHISICAYSSFNQERLAQITGLTQDKYDLFISKRSDPTSIIEQIQLYLF